MSYPWPSFGGFKFKREEHPIWGTDAGWVRTPSYTRQRPLGSSTDAIAALAIGSAERTFEIHLTPERFSAMEIMLNSRATFTDWGRPIPDSRSAFLSELSPQEDVISDGPLSLTGRMERKRRVKVTLVSA